MISTPMLAARNDQMICCSQRSLIGLPFTGMRFGGTSSPGAVAMTPLNRCRRSGRCGERTGSLSAQMPVDAVIGMLGTQVITHTYLTAAILAHRNGETGVVDDAVPDPGD